LNQFPYVFFLGIGGIGMSALARWFHTNGHHVSGYDKTETPLTLALQAEGIAVHYTDEVESIPADIRDNKAQTLVVLTPAIPADSREWAWLREQGYDIRKRSQVPTAKRPRAAWWRICCITRGWMQVLFWAELL
jgi:UDP-N-acetylmuramate--alanine ligase